MFETSQTKWDEFVRLPRRNWLVREAMAGIGRVGCGAQQRARQSVGFLGVV